MNRSLVVLSSFIIGAAAAGCGDEVTLCDPSVEGCVSNEPGPVCEVSELLSAGETEEILVEVLDENGAEVQGEARRVDFEDAIDAFSVQGYSLAADGSCEPESPVFNRFVVQKFTDRSTPILLEKAAAGAVLQSVKLSQLIDSGEARSVPYEWTLSNALVENVQIASDFRQLERWTLSFERLQLIYRRLPDDFGAPEEVAFCWDLVLNESCAP
ncbi:MAG: type VI secretion system tube protein Hcp [Deltaproteobacteria bacterium]|nr:type VI secretion system tube protein Hcp [Deltaproteobacteria bacterium]NNK07179.1 hypothetical protein [Myxococcales bacterium]MBT8464154.1 type VI secretion system tube protein Hcp [Deltaproteobacteria bacterium]MBT8481572.1 type VI secretion system tube protein Hcp [Deltaproteobacteria bacterium]NNK43867.1 hypothetical protein [Myxococcales bacterium]